VANREIVVDRGLESGARVPAWRYLEILWSDSMGRPVIALGAAGAIWMLAADRSRAFLLLLFPMAFLGFISMTAPASRYLNPLLPFIAICAAWMLARLSEPLRVPRAVFWIVAVACAVPPLSASIESNRFFRLDDTRTLARRFIETNIPSGATVLIQPYSVPLTPSHEGLSEALTRNLGSVDAASTKFRLQLSLDPYPEPSYRLIWLGRGGLDADKIYVDPGDLGQAHGLAPLDQLGVTYVVLKRYNRLDPETMPLVAELARRARLIAVFSPYRPGTSEARQARIEPFLHNTDTRIDDALERPGPPLEIWQLNGPHP
jgi:hypothetical protein